MNPVRFAPGAGLLVVHAGAVVLVDGDLDRASQLALWDIVRAEGRADDRIEGVLQHLSSVFGLRRLPPFVLASTSDEGHWLLIRGGYEVTLDDETVTSSASAPWTERRLPGTPRLSVGAIGDASWLVASGLVGAAGFSTAAPSAEADDSDGYDDVRRAADAALEVPGPVPGARAAVSSLFERPATVAHVQPEPEPEPEPSVAAADGQGDESYGFTELFGRRQRAAAEEAAAAVAGTEPVPAAPTPVDVDSRVDQPSTVGDTRTWSEDAGEPKPDPEPDPTPRSSGLIDAVPLFPSVAEPPPTPGPPAPATSPPLSPPSPQQSAHPHEGARSVNEEDEVTQHRASVVLGRVAHQVLAVLCPSGHQTPPHSEVCRVCGRAVGAQEPQWVPRPSLGRLRLPDGETLDLDRGVIFGRAPREQTDAVERPHVLNLSRYGPHLSRMHLELIVEDWFVMARDLGSTAGSTITIPGHPPEKLRAHEQVSLEPGTVIDLAGDYVFTYEVVP